jgi:hypothetical protein
VTRQGELFVAVVEPTICGDVCSSVLRFIKVVRDMAQLLAAVIINSPERLMYPSLRRLKMHPLGAEPGNTNAEHTKLLHGARPGK